MGCIWTALGNRLETAWKRPTKPNSKRPKDGEIIDEEKSVRRQSLRKCLQEDELSRCR